MAVTWKKVAFEDDAILKSVVTTKGDILYATASATLTRLGIGTDTYILNRDTATDVPAWKDPATLTLALHEATHKNAGSDEILLNEFGEATGAVAFDGQQATDLVVHTASSPPTEVLGKWYVDAEDLALYICTSIA